jgi:PhoH-like ATPase
MTKSTPKKIFVLDTSVILYDHTAIHNFEEHDVAIPITVLEELDNFKKGNSTMNFAAREFIRKVDEISDSSLLQDWVPLNGPTHGKFRVLLDTGVRTDALRIFGDGKADHKILNAALALQESEKKAKVILVTKDISLRLKAKSLNLVAEDYKTGKVDDDNLYVGKTTVEDADGTLVDRLFAEGSIPVESVGVMDFPDNHFITLRHGKQSAMARYHAAEQRLLRIEKSSVYGIKARNAEQTFAISALLNPAIKLVTIQGVAGTGKTLLALACALEQRRDFQQIYLARPVVPLSNKDIGFLPGDVKEKLNPYMEPLWDNLKFIKNVYEETDKEYKAIDEMVRTEKLSVTPLAYIRGRSLSNVFFIVDEAQNLTPHEVKTIITRAGENCKIVFTGDIHQIDTPYLDAQSNGLSYLIERMKGQSLFAHVTLEKGERSELANLANILL